MEVVGQFCTAAVRIRALAQQLFAMVRTSVAVLMMEDGYLPSMCGFGAPIYEWKSQREFRMIH